ncbi:MULTISPECIES: hypothetical protein [Lactobacillaceae]|uniref:Uncharacterized protein n=1 Tax=Ligilactobacillus agilis TaxID=1601 RepID=A0A6F9XUZ6_9LACO|nr:MULTISPECIES: hypothetical protein [Lactobacillaceae]GET08960.1 hypothetical protein SY111_15840 [Ligilactobacillus agilis]
MKTIHVKRNFTFIDDRSTKYFVINGKVKGRIGVLIDNQFKTDEAQDEVYVKDFFGIRSNILKLNEDGEFFIEYKLNTVWLICTYLMLLLTFIFIAIMGISSIRQYISNHLIYMILLPGVWVLYISITLLFLRNKLYIITKRP